MGDDQAHLQKAASTAFSSTHTDPTGITFFEPRLFVTNDGTVANASHVTVTDNESENEENLITFVEDAATATGNHGLEMDGNLTYNPSTGTITSTKVSTTNLTATSGTFTGKVEADEFSKLNGKM